MKALFRILSLVFIIQFTPISASADMLGQGFACINHLIYKKGKHFTLKAANKKINAKIKKLGTRKKDKAKKGVLKKLKKSFKVCMTSSDPNDPGDAGDIYGPDLKKITAMNFVSENYQGSYLGGSAFGDMKFDVNFSADSLTFSFHLFPNKNLVNSEKSFSCVFNNAATLPLPAAVQSASTELGNINCEFTKKSFANESFFLLTIVNDSIPVEIRSNPDAAKFSLLLYNKKDIASPPGHFEGFLTTFEESGKGILGSTVVVK